VLVVHKLLALANLVSTPSSHTYQVLALSAYVAAWQSQLSRKRTVLAGDHVVVAGNGSPLSLRKWVSQRNIHVTEHSIVFTTYESERSLRSPQAQAEPSAELATTQEKRTDPLAQAESSVKSKHCGCSWLDGEEGHIHGEVEAGCGQGVADDREGVRA
jgi:hypothetical protein